MRMISNYMLLYTIWSDFPITKNLEMFRARDMCFTEHSRPTLYSRLSENSFDEYELDPWWSEMKWKLNMIISVQSE